MDSSLRRVVYSIVGGVPATPERPSQNSQLHPVNYGETGRAPQSTQSYTANYEQAGWAPQNPQSSLPNYRQAESSPQNQNQQLYPANYGQAGRGFQHPQQYPATYLQVGGVSQNPQLYPANYGQAGGTPQSPQLYAANYGQPGGAHQNPQSYPATSGQAAGPSENPHLHLQNYGNPITAFFTVVFKGCAVVFYIFCGWFTDSFIIHFVIVSMLMAFDFWTVKNVSGRILVGMRWWNDVDEQGESVWRFESLDQETLAKMNANDSWLFWWSLYITCALWIVFGIVAVLKFSFDYLLLVCISLSLCSANIIGFTKCRKDAKRKVQAFAQSAVAAGMREAMTGGIARGIQRSLGI